MTKQKQTKAAERMAPKKSVEQKPATKSEAEEDLVVFAFRLTPAERELVHAAAGPGRASRFVRALAVAAASGDADAVMALLGGPAPAIN